MYTQEIKTRVKFVYKSSRQRRYLYTLFHQFEGFFRVKAKVTFVYFCQISDEICILLVNRELVLWDGLNLKFECQSVQYWRTKVI